MKHTQPAPTTVTGRSLPADRRMTGAAAPAKLVHQRRGEKQAREPLAIGIDQVAKSLASLEAAVRSIGMERLLRRVDDIEAALYELQALHAVSQANGAEASRRIANLQLLSRIRTVVRDTVPQEAVAIVISKGDPELMKLPGRTAWHFPQTSDGAYAGAHPATSTAAIAHLETLRAHGGDYLIVPSPSAWWLDHYVGFREHLTRRYRLIADSKETCLIFALREPAVAQGAATSEAFQALVVEFQDRYNRAPSILDWDSSLDLAARFQEHTIFSPPGQKTVLPYLDGSIDIAVLSSSIPDVLAEATRVAGAATVRVDCDRGESRGSALSIEWKQNGARPALLNTSIIIPCHNQVRETTACLTSLFETLPGNFTGEIIVVDDASTDETPALLERLAATDKRLTIVRNAENTGFILSCNRGAGVATGDLLLFLNNDTVLMPGWLPPLVRVFRGDVKAGVVGGRLLFPDGRLQEAGGMIFRDGSAAHFGRGDYDADRFLYQFVREVDYCSGALLATRRSLFEKLDGFDRRYRPAYYEDVDYCFKARKSGYRVYYQPESTIVHLEGATSGVDPRRGTKRYFTLNQRKFVEKWKRLLRSYPVRPSHDDAAAWQALAVGTRAGK